MDAKKINRVTWILLGVGLASAIVIVIYFTAEPEKLDPLLGDQFKSKRYIHDLGVIGGKSNVMTAEFIEWVKSLFHGPTLGVTVAVLTIITTICFRFFASLPDFEPLEPGSREGEASKSGDI